MFTPPKIYLTVLLKSRGRSHLVPIKKQVTRGGKTFTQTFYVRPEDIDKDNLDTPETLKQYSEKYSNYNGTFWIGLGNDIVKMPEDLIAGVISYGGVDLVIAKEPKYENGEYIVYSDSNYAAYETISGLVIDRGGDVKTCIENSIKKLDFYGPEKTKEVVERSKLDTGNKKMGVTTINKPRILETPKREKTGLKKDIATAVDTIKNKVIEGLGGYYDRYSEALDVWMRSLPNYDEDDLYHLNWLIDYLDDYPQLPKYYMALVSEDYEQDPEDPLSKLDLIYTIFSEVYSDDEITNRLPDIFDWIIRYNLDSGDLKTVSENQVINGFNDDIVPDDADDISAIYRHGYDSDHHGPLSKEAIEMLDSWCGDYSYVTYSRRDAAEYYKNNPASTYPEDNPGLPDMLRLIITNGTRYHGELWRGTKNRNWGNLNPRDVVPLGIASFTEDPNVLGTFSDGVIIKLIPPEDGILNFGVSDLGLDLANDGVDNSITEYTHESERIVTAPKLKVIKKYGATHEWYIGYTVVECEIAFDEEVTRSVSE